MQATRIGFGVALCCVVTLGVCHQASAQTVWSGEDTTFTKANFADWTLPENQDRITSNVWITRQDMWALINAQVESGFTSCAGPMPTDTEWAFGRAVDWQTLTFSPFLDDNFVACAPGNGTFLNQPAVLHLITDDVYLDITFTSWTTGSGGQTGGGGVSYMRASGLANDLCTQAEPITGEGSFSYDNTTATTGSNGQVNAGCNQFGTSGIDNDLWYCWTAECSGAVRIETCGTTASDTKIAVYSGCDCSGLELDQTGTRLVVCNDDDCGLQSGVDFTVVAGESYLVQVGNFPGTSGGTGSLVVDVTPDGSQIDSCPCALDIAGEITQAFDTSNATTDGAPDGMCGNGQIENDIWYCWTAPCDGAVSIETCGMASFDTQIAVYDGCAPGPIIVCNDDSCGLQSRVIFNAVAGNQYKIRIGNYPNRVGGTGSFTINCLLPGACCMPDGTCVQEVEPNCSGFGSVFLGEGTLCETASCLGACCLCDLTCQDLDAGACDLAGGVFLGVGSDCAGVVCPDLTPINDDCVGAIPVENYPYKIRGKIGGGGYSTQCATPDVVPAGCDGDAGNPGLWFSLTGNGNIWDISVCGGVPFRGGGGGPIADGFTLSIFCGPCESLSCIESTQTPCYYPLQLCTEVGVEYYLLVSEQGSGQTEFGVNAFDLGIPCETPVSCSLPCDWDGNGTLDSNDYFDFLNDFFAGNADYNNSGGTDSNDYFDFLNCFFGPGGTR